MLGVQNNDELVVKSAELRMSAGREQDMDWKDNESEKGRNSGQQSGRQKTAAGAR